MAKNRRGDLVSILSPGMCVGQPAPGCRSRRVGTLWRRRQGRSAKWHKGAVGTKTWVLVCGHPLVVLSAGCRSHVLPCGAAQMRC